MTPMPHAAFPGMHLPRRQASKLSPVYVAIWALMASLALGYLGLLATRPDLAELLVSGAPKPVADATRMGVPLDPSVIDDLKQRVGALQRQIDELKDTAAVREKRDAELVARVAALELAASKVAEEASVLAAQKAAHVAPAAKPDVLTGVTVTGTIEERPVRAARVASAQTPSPVRALPPSGIQIATGPSLDSLRLSWQLLQEGNRSPLKSLEPRFVETQQDPATYALVAGPLATPEDAAKVCVKLKAKRISCSVTPFAGQPL